MRGGLPGRGHQAADGDFDFSACSTHNYREFMGGFTDWVETIADSADADDYRSPGQRFRERLDVAEPVVQGRTTRRPTAWPSAPRARTSSSPFLDDRKGFMDLVLKPLQEKKETAVRAAEFGGQGARRTPLSAQAGQGRGQRDQRALKRPRNNLSALRRLPLHEDHRDGGVAHQVNWIAVADHVAAVAVFG